MSGKQLKKKKKGIKTKVEKDFGFGNLGLAADIGVPAAVTDGDTSYGNNPSAPQTSVSYWPAANLWYAQGKQAAKKTYFNYMNDLNTYLTAPQDQTEKKLDAAGKLNNTITSMIQGVSIATDALENCQRKVRTGDQASVIEKEVISDSVERILKTIWIHNTAAYQGKFPGFEVRLIEAPLTARLNRMNDWGVTDVGMPLASAEEADSLWVEETPVVPPEVGSEGLETGSVAPAEDEGIEAPEGVEEWLSADQAPPPENEAAEEFAQVAPDAGQPAPAPDQPEGEYQDEEEPELPVEMNDNTPIPDNVPATEPELPVEYPEEAPVEESMEEGPDESVIPSGDTEIMEEEVPEEGLGEEDEIANTYDDLKTAFEQFQAEDPEAAALLLEELNGEELEEELPEEETQAVEGEPQIATFDQLKNEGQEEVPEEEVVEEEVPVEEEEEIVEEEPEEGEVEEEEIVEEAPEGEEVVEEEIEEEPEGEEEEVEEEEPEEDEFVYCIHCDKDVDPEDIENCEEEGCPFHKEEIKGEESEEEVEEEEPEEEEIEEPKKKNQEKHFIMLGTDDHSKCQIHKITVKDFSGVEGTFCLQHGMVNYSFDQGIWSSEDAQLWVSKQLKIKKEFHKTPEEIIAEKIDSVDPLILKEWLSGKKEPETEMVELDVETFSSAFENIIENAFEPIKKRLNELEA